MPRTSVLLVWPARARALVITPGAKAAARIATPLVALTVLCLAAGAAQARVYHWAGGPGPASWSTPTNWRPTRSISTPDDIIVLDTSATITKVPTQRIGELHVTGGCTVTLQDSAAATLTINGRLSATSFEVALGSTLDLNGTVALSITLDTLATGVVAGTVNFSGAPHRLAGKPGATLAIASGGTIATSSGFTGNLFGTTPPHWVVFQSGSAYDCGAGGDPFGPAEPAAVATFQHGSLYSHRNAAGPPSFSGRTYADVEIRAPGYEYTSTGGDPLTCDDFNVVAGIQHMQLATVNIKGDVFVGSDQALDFNPTAPMALNLNGTASQHVTRAGSLTLNDKARLTLDNPAGITFLSPMKLRDSIFVTAGTALVVATGAPLRVDSAGVLTVAPGASLTLGDSLTNRGSTLVYGTLRLDSGGCVGGNSDIGYGPGSRLIYDTGATLTPAREWTGGASTGSGVPKHVTLESGTLALPAADRYCPGDLAILGGLLSMNATSGDLHVGGNWSLAGGTFLPNHRAVRFYGGNWLTMTGATTFDELRLEGGTWLALLADVTIQERLTFAAGRIQTFANKVVIGNAANVSGAGNDGYVIGNLQRMVDVDPFGTAQQLFEIGDVSGYTPLYLETPGTGIASGRVTASTTPGDHPLIASSGIAPERSVNRVWSLMNDGLSYHDTFRVSFTFLPADVDSGANPLNFIVRDFGAGAWYPTVAGTRDSLHTQAQYVPLFGDFAIGEPSPAPRLLSLSPNRGGNTGSVTVQFAGLSLAPGAGIKLWRSDRSDIPGTGVVVAPDGLSLAATFDLDGTADGDRYAIVTNPDGRTDTLGTPFAVTATAAPQLRVDLLGPALIRADRRTAFDLVIENPGNVDALAVPLWLHGIPVDAGLELGFLLTPPPQASAEPDWSAVPLGFSDASGRYLPVVIPRVPPGTTLRRVYLTVPATDPTFELRAAIAPPWLDGAPFRSCLTTEGIANPGCVGGSLTDWNAYFADTTGVDAVGAVGLWAKLAWQCEGAATLPAALTEAEQVLGAMAREVETPDTTWTVCRDELFPRWRDSLVVTIVGSVDPNVKLGSRDSLSLQQAVPYSIRFENDSSATGPAQQVAVADPLDVSMFDPTTVSLEAITFGSVRVVPPPGLGSYATRVDLRPGMNLLVDIRAYLDFGGVLHWYFDSIDPATGQPPTDPLAGFLPPNVTPPEGEGSVLFTVMPRASLTGGSQIHNSATIVFDTGSPTTTTPWSNIVDGSPPKSHVLPLAPHTSTSTIPVGWMSEDSPPDLRDFTIYVSEDGAPYRVWRLNTVARSDTLAPPGDHCAHTYAFYSVARDLAGNVESTPSVADATTQSLLAVDPARPLQLALEGARPNPSTGALRVWFTLPSREPATLELIDVAGRRVLRRDVGALGAGTHGVALDAGRPLRPGLYFLRLAQGSRALHARVAIIR